MKAAPPTREREKAGGRQHHKKKGRGGERSTTQNNEEKQHPHHGRKARATATLLYLSYSFTFYPSYPLTLLLFFFSNRFSHFSSFFFVSLFFLFLIEYRAFLYPYTTSTEHEPKQQCTARAGALMAHHPAWVSHHTGGSRSTPTVHQCRYDGRLWVAQHRPTTHDSDRQ